MNIAFVYDWFDTPIGGAEHIIKVLHEQYPDAVWYTAFLDTARAPWARGWRVKTSFLQRCPSWFKRSRLLCLPFLPLAFESFDFSGFDVVISISSGFAKNIITTARTQHICYLLTPPRWLYKFKVQSSKFKVFEWLIRKMGGYLRGWDYQGAQRVDTYVSISKEVAQRCNEYYGRESEVIYPPFNSKYWEVLSRQHVSDESNIDSTPCFACPPIWRACTVPVGTPFDNAQDKPHRTAQNRCFCLKRRNYFLVVSRLEPYKRIDLAIEAFKQFKTQNSKLIMPDQNVWLVIVGTGSQEKKLRKLSDRLGIGKDVVWRQHIADEELAWLYSNCCAFIMPQEEDFGYVACEASFFGAPIIAYAKGGQIEILHEYPNKILFDEQSASSIVLALEKIATFGYNAKTHENSHLRRWSRDSFVATFSQKISKAV